MALPEKTQIINEATQVSSIEADFFLIGWQGSANKQAPLICLSSQQLVQFIESKIASATGFSTLSSDAPVAKVSLEELFDEANNQYKDCFIQYSISGSQPTILTSKNVDATTPININTTIDGQPVYVINTGIRLQDIEPATIQVSQVVSDSVGFSFVYDSSEFLMVAVKAVDSKVNVFFKAPLVGEGVSLNLVQE